MLLSLTSFPEMVRLFKQIIRKLKDRKTISIIAKYSMALFWIFCDFTFKSIGFIWFKTNKNIIPSIWMSPINSTRKILFSRILPRIPIIAVIIITNITAITLYWTSTETVNCKKFFFISKALQEFKIQFCLSYNSDTQIRNRIRIWRFGNISLQLW